METGDSPSSEESFPGNYSIDLPGCYLKARVNSSIFSFLEENWFDMDAAGTIPENTLFALYDLWCLIENQPRASRKSFFQVLEGSEKPLSRAKGLVAGIRLNDIGETMRESLLEEPERSD